MSKDLKPEGDWSGKHRPLLERITCMRGRATGLVIAFGGGAPQLTDGDIAAAVGYARTHDYRGEEIAPTIRPELLQLHYAGMGEFTYRAARAAWNAICSGIEKADGPLARRGCILAAEAIGGRPLTREVVEQEAWLVVRRREDLEAFVGRAGAWLQGELYDGGSAYINFLSRVMSERTDQFELDRKARHERSENRRAVQRCAPKEDSPARPPRLDDIAQAIANIDARKRGLTAC